MGRVISTGGWVGGSPATLANPVPSYIMAAADPRMFSSTNTFTANAAYATRLIAQRAGTIMDFCVYITTSAGNIDVGIYNTAATTRTKLWSSGSTASPGTGWRNIGDPGIVCDVGQEFDFVIAGDSSSLVVAKLIASGSVTTTMPIGWDGDGGSPMLNWSKTSSFPLPTTFTEAAVTAGGNTHALMARIV